MDYKESITRHSTKTVKIGNKIIGGNNMILIQSMCNTKTEDVDATVNQIHELEDSGCDIIRVAVPNKEAAMALSKIKSKINIPLVADIHFDYRLAIEAINNGADKIRINPGNIGEIDKIEKVVLCAKNNNIPIRVGVNSGSLEKELVDKYRGVSAQGLVESALDKLKIIEALGYDNLVVSIKSSNVLMSIKAHELLAEKCNYPIHIGITEAGSLIRGSIKSSLGLGVMLYNGIGDTIRVSLTDEPVKEVECAKMILSNLGIRSSGIEVVSCPTCGRTNINLIDLVSKVEELVKPYKHNLKIAVMGCVVNGPGESKEADFGITGGDGCGLIFKKGEIIKKVKEDQLLAALKEELDNYEAV